MQKKEETERIKELKNQNAKGLEKPEGDDEVRFPKGRKRAWQSATALRLIQDSVKSPPSLCGSNLRESSPHRMKPVVRGIRAGRKVEVSVCSLCPGLCECPTYYSAMGF